jgi:hypothetical protein
VAPFVVDMRPHVASVDGVRSLWGGLGGHHRGDADDPSPGPYGAKEPPMQPVHRPASESCPEEKRTHCVTPFLEKSVTNYRGYSHLSPPVGEGPIVTSGVREQKTGGGLRASELPAQLHEKHVEVSHVHEVDGLLGTDQPAAGAADGTI